MKLIVEIINEEFSYSCEIGSSKHNGKKPFDLDGLNLFNELVNHLNKKAMEDRKRKREAIAAYAFCKAYPEMIEGLED